jgi:recombinational DNA repair protein (RecF pathway)
LQEGRHDGRAGGIRESIMAVGESDRIDTVLTALRGLLMAVAALLA